MTALEQLELQEVELPQGTIRYRELGTGAPIVLVHGLLANGLLWAQVAPELAREFRVIVPDWPLGAHTTPLRPEADRTPPGLSALIAGFLEALDLGRIPGAPRLVAHTLRPCAVQRLPFALGWLSKRPLAPAVVDALLHPLRTDARIGREVAAILRGISSRYTVEAATRFGTFDKPVLVAWAVDDRVFPLAHAERLAAAFPQGRLERIEDSYTFVPVDQPARTAELVGAFARGLTTAPTR